MSPIYRKDIFSFEQALYIVLSWVHSTLCKEVPPSKMIVVYIYSSLLRYGLLFSCLFMFFMLFLGLGYITFGIKALSSGLASAKRVILEILIQHFFYMDSEIKVKNPPLKKENKYPILNLDHDPLQCNVPSLVCRPEHYLIL